MYRPVALLLALALALSACASAGDEGAEIQLMLFGDAQELAGYEQMVAEFEAANPDVDVTLSPVAKQDDLLAKLTTSFAGGAPPDVFLVNFRKYGQFAAQGVLADVQPFLDASDVLDPADFTPTAFDAFRYDGESLTCFPQNLSSLVVYFNVDLFEAAGLPLPAMGWTWDDFLAAATALTDGDVYGLGTDPKVIRVAPFVWSNGGEVVDDPLAPTTLTLDTGPAREALDWFLDLSLVHGVVPPDREEQAEDSESRFLNGRLGMYLNSRRVTPTMRTIEGFRWDVATLPVAPGGTPASILHSDAYCLSADGDTEAAWRLVEFAMGERGQTILASSGRTVPSRFDVQASEAFLDRAAGPPTPEVFIRSAETVRATPHTATWTQVEKLADDILEEIFYGRLDREAGIARLIEDTRPRFGAS